MIYLLQHILRDALSKHSQKTAFICSNEKLTYGELDKKSNQLANLLIAKKIKRGERIGIFMPRCLESVIAVYGILKSGAAYVPLDPFAPTHRTAAIMKDCNIKTLVTIPNQKIE